MNMVPDNKNDGNVLVQSEMPVLSVQLTPDSMKDLVEAVTAAIITVVGEMNKTEDTDERREQSEVRSGDDIQPEPGPDD